MKRRGAGSNVVGALLAVALLAGPLGAQTVPDTTPSGGESAGEPFGGTFLFLPSESPDMEDVVDRGVSLVKSWYKRPFARGRIAEVNQAYEWMQIFPSSSAVRVSTPAWSLDIPRQGSLAWVRAPDDTVDVTIDWTGEAWVHRLEADDGTRVNRYVLGPDGERLTLHVTITSDQLRGPLEYDLVYRRR